jgi:hypothetical protein
LAELLKDKDRPMIAPIVETCTFDGYTPAWQLGTGLQIALAPGEYQVTGRDRINERVYARLDDLYRVDVGTIPVICRQSVRAFGMPLAGL